MRTTIRLDDDLHRAIGQIAQRDRQSFTRATTDLLREGLAVRQQSGRLVLDPRTGLPAISFGQPVTAQQTLDWMEQDE
jgi:predicted transcriptional regulator